MNAPGDNSVRPASAEQPRRHDFTEAARLPAIDAFVAATTGRLAEALERELGSALRFPVACAPGGSARQAHRDIVAGLSTGAVCMPLVLGRSAGEGWLSIERGLAFSLADRRYGGPGSVSDDGRVISTSEWRLCSLLCAGLCRALEHAWAPTGVLSVLHAGDGGLESASADAERFAGQSPDGQWYECVLRIDSGDGPAGCTLLLSHATVAGLMPHTAASHVQGARNDTVFDTPFGKGLAAGVRGCGIELVGVLAERGMTLGDLQALQTGDFLALDERRPVSFRAEGRPLFDARLGLDAGRLCASVTRLHLPVADS